MKITNLLIISSFFASLASCDEGRLYEEGRTSSAGGLDISMSASIMNVASWPSSYTVSIAAFEEGNDYALIAKSIGTVSSETGRYEMTLSNIPSEASSIEICVVNRLRQKIASFYYIDIDYEENHEFIVSEPINVNMFDVIQNNVFTTTCVNCHGNSNFVAGNLYLTVGKSYENLVDVESTVMGEGNLRVKSGSRKGSVLYNILTGDESGNWNYDHSSEITDYNTLELIGAWIDNGANY